MDSREEKIRMRTYEIWERQGRMGSPDDHWFEAERELRAEEQPTEASQDRSDATVEEALLLRLGKPSQLPATALRKANVLPGHQGLTAAPDTSSVL
jgi:hypothetical protein